MNNLFSPELVFSGSRRSFRVRVEHFNLMCHNKHKKINGMAVLKRCSCLLPFPRSSWVPDSSGCLSCQADISPLKMCNQLFSPRTACCYTDQHSHKATRLNARLQHICKRDETRYNKWQLPTRSGRQMNVTTFPPQSSTNWTNAEKDSFKRDTETTQPVRLNCWDENWHVVKSGQDNVTSSRPNIWLHLQPAMYL